MSKMGEVNNTLTRPVNVNLEEMNARFKWLKGINPGVTHTRQAGRVLNNPNIETVNMVVDPQVVESVHDTNDLPCGESDNSVRDSHMEESLPSFESGPFVISGTIAVGITDDRSHVFTASNVELALPRGSTGQQMQPQSFGATSDGIALDVGCSNQEKPVSRDSTGPIISYWCIDDGDINLSTLVDKNVDTSSSFSAPLNCGTSDGKADMVSPKRLELPLVDPV